MAGICKNPAVLVLAWQQERRREAVCFGDDPDSTAARQDVARQEALTGRDRPFVLLSIGVGHVAPIAAQVADEQIDDRNPRVGDDLQRTGRGKDATELEARANVMGVRNVQDQFLLKTRER